MCSKLRPCTKRVGSHFALLAKHVEVYDYIFQILKKYKFQYIRHAISYSSTIFFASALVFQQKLKNKIESCWNLNMCVIKQRKLNIFYYHAFLLVYSMMLYLELPNSKFQYDIRIQRTYSIRIYMVKRILWINTYLHFTLLYSIIPCCTLQLTRHQVAETPSICDKKLYCIIWLVCHWYPWNLIYKNWFQKFQIFEIRACPFFYN